jgi:hypothetical protein
MGKVCLCRPTWAARYTVDDILYYPRGSQDIGIERQSYHYVDGNNQKIDEALGNTEWRQRWKSVTRPTKSFMPFLATEFSRSMQTHNYLEQHLDQMKMVRSDEKNLRLYYLALFSRHKTAYKFWDDVLKYGTDQSQFVWE